MKKKKAKEILLGFLTVLAVICAGLGLALAFFGGATLNFKDKDIVRAWFCFLYVATFFVVAYGEEKLGKKLMLIPVLSFILLIVFGAAGVLFRLLWELFLYAFF